MSELSKEICRLVRAAPTRPPCKAVVLSWSLRCSALLSVTLLLCLVGCAEEEASEDAVDPLTVAAFAPQAGGQVQPLGNYAVELVPTADGRLQVHLRDAQGQPVTPDGATLTAEVANGEKQRSVTLVRDAEQPHYVGVVPGITGSHPVKVILSSPEEQAPEVETTFPAVMLAATAVNAEPWHNGQVSFVGDNRVEVATASDGQVTVSVTDLDGSPVPPQAVDLRTVHITTPEGPRIIPLQPQGPVFVGHFGAPPPPRFNATVDLRIRGRHYPRVRIRHAHPLPPGVVVHVAHRPPAPVVVHGPWGPPPPPVVDVHIGHPGGGWSKGHGWRGHPGKGWGKGHGRRGHPGRGWAKGHGGRGHPGRGHGKRGRPGRGHGKRGRR